MKPTKQLILGLRDAAHKLRNNLVHYYWYNGATCNCGILMQCLLDKNDLNGIDLQLGCWSNASESFYCKNTGLEYSLIFNLLKQVGLNDWIDFHRIEFVCSFDKTIYQNPKEVANYFDKLANELELQRKERFTTSKE